MGNKISTEKRMGGDLCDDAFYHRNYYLLKKAVKLKIITDASLI